MNLHSFCLAAGFLLSIDSCAGRLLTHKNLAKKIKKNEASNKLRAGRLLKKNEGPTEPVCGASPQVCGQGGRKIYICHHDKEHDTYETLCIPEVSAKSHMKNHDDDCGECVVTNPVNPVVEELLQAGISQHHVELFSEDIFNAIAVDAPTGFVPGQISLYNDPVQPELQMNFEAIDSQFDLEGTFSPTLAGGGIPAGTTARVYSQAGLCGEAAVDGETGYFALTLTDIKPGLTPFLMIFSSILFDGATRRNRHRFMQEANTPTLFWCVHETACPLGLTYALRWNQPTSDVDLHVVEPGLTKVWYGNMDGVYGSLDVDDVDGYGPEHYSAPLVEAGQTFTASVHLFSLDQDVLPVDYTLEAYHNGKHLWTHQGSLTYDDEMSEDFSVTIEPEGEVTCATCKVKYDESNPPERKQRKLEPIDYGTEEPYCCGQLDKWHHWYCPPFCDDDDIYQSWKMYQEIATLVPTRSNMLFHLNGLVNPFLNIPHQRAAYSVVIDKVRSEQGDWECVRYWLLDIYCRMSKGRQLEPYITAMSVIGGIADAAAIVAALPLAGWILAVEAITGVCATVGFGPRYTEHFRFLLDKFALTVGIVNWQVNIVTECF